MTPPHPNQKECSKLGRLISIKSNLGVFLGVRLKLGPISKLKVKIEIGSVKLKFDRSKSSTLIYNIVQMIFSCALCIDAIRQRELDEIHGGSHLWCRSGCVLCRSVRIRKFSYIIMVENGMITIIHNM